MYHEGRADAYAVSVVTLEKSAHGLDAGLTALVDGVKCPPYHHGAAVLWRTTGTRSGGGLS